MQTGSRMIVANVWTDAAREAAAAARATGSSSFTPEHHTKAAEAHTKAAGLFGKDSPEYQHHMEAADMHSKASTAMNPNNQYAAGSRGGGTPNKVRKQAQMSSALARYKSAGINPKDMKK